MRVGEIGNSRGNIRIDGIQWKLTLEKYVLL